MWASRYRSAFIGRPATGSQHPLQYGEAPKYRPQTVEPELQGHPQKRPQSIETAMPIFYYTVLYCTILNDHTMRPLTSGKSKCGPGADADILETKACQEQ